MRVGFYQGQNNLRACATGTRNSVEAGDRVMLSLTCSDLPDTPCDETIPSDTTCPSID